MDDEVLQMEALCETLSSRGYSTVGASHGEAAMEKLRTEKFDLILTDLTMPGMDGIEVLRRAFSLDPELVGIIMTGQGTIATAVDAMREGALDFILKPFKVSTVMPVISRALEVRKLRMENAKLQAAMYDRTIALEAANESLDAFARSVAHDLIAPARHMAGFARLVLEQHGASLHEDAYRKIEMIAVSGERMTSLITDLLNFSRFARAELKHQPVDLGPLMSEIWEELQAQRQLLEPESKDREFAWKIGDLPVVTGDLSLLRQVFVNLLSNSMKYTRGKRPAEVEVGYRGSEGDLAVLFVRDNGAGFDMRYATELFGIFNRLHSAKEFEGNGVGLATVRQIVQRHGGRVWAEGQVGKGATFFVALPV